MTRASHAADVLTASKQWDLLVSITLPECNTLDKCPGLPSLSGAETCLVQQQASDIEVCIKADVAADHGGCAARHGPAVQDQQHRRAQPLGHLPQRQQSAYFPPHAVNQCRCWFRLRAQYKPFCPERWVGVGGEL